MALMMKNNYFVQLNHRQTVDLIGNKAKNLGVLQRLRCQVPNTFICTMDAYEAYQRDDLRLVSILRQELQQKLDPNKVYAVRSSANLEDERQYSFAGQFKTYLWQSGVDQIFSAIWGTWASCQSDAVKVYLAKMTSVNECLKMAVVVQEMVHAQVSGVAFSRNPISGLDEFIVEAVLGNGAQLVQDGVTPHRWVYKWGIWKDKPDQDQISTDLIEQVVKQGRQISSKLRKDIDLEWAYDGQHIYWLQLREITTLKDARIYSNKISKEMIPGMVKPLVWSVSIPVNASQVARILAELSGQEMLDPSALVKSFYYRAYFEMNAFGKVFSKLGMPRESLELMFGIESPNERKKIRRPPGMQMLFQTPNLLVAIYRKWRTAVAFKQVEIMLRNAYQNFSMEQIPNQEPPVILANLDRLMSLYEVNTYYNILMPVFMHIFGMLLSKTLARSGLDIRDYDLTAELEEIKQYDPNSQLQALHLEYLKLDEVTQAKVLQLSYAELKKPPVESTFIQKLDAFLDQFGHLSDSGVDFSYPTWRENPELILQLIAAYKQPADMIARKSFKEISPGFMRGWLLNRLYQTSCRYRLYRESISSLYTQCLALLRVHYLALGEEMTLRGWLDSRFDIFYLCDQEIRASILEITDPSGLAPKVLQRKQEMEKNRDIQLPVIIYGDTPPPVMPFSGSKLIGVATSKGYYVGRAKVIEGLQAFSRVEPGDVLVIPYSDIGWAPLLAKAGAVVSESGGLLSHSSIIAREYGIPAVVSVIGAMGIPDSCMVSVDGYKGEVLIHQSD